MNNGEWTLSQDWVVVSKIAEYRSVLKKTSSNVGTVKENFAKTMKTDYGILADRSESAIVQHLDFLDKVISGEYVASNVPEKYREFVGIEQLATI